MWLVAAVASRRASWWLQSQPTNLYLMWQMNREAHFAFQPAGLFTMVSWGVTPHQTPQRLWGESEPLVLQTPYRSPHCDAQAVGAKCQQSRCRSSKGGEEGGQAAPTELLCQFFLCCCFSGIATISYASLRVSPWSLCLNSLAVTLK